MCQRCGLSTFAGDLFAGFFGSPDSLRLKTSLHTLNKRDSEIAGAILYNSSDWSSSLKNWLYALNVGLCSII